MYFSSKELTQLINNAITDNRIDELALKGLLYYLNFPTDEIPLFIAETICNEPNLISKQDKLGKRLAFGHVNELSEFRNPDLRTNRQIRISRQLNRIALYLEEHKAPSRIILDFSALCHSFIQALLFFEARKNEERQIYAAEEVLLLEQLIFSTLSSQELSLKFYELLFLKLGDQKSQTLAASLLKRLEESRMNTNLNNETILDPNFSPPIPEYLEHSDGFEQTIIKLTTFLEKKVGFRSDFH